MFKLLLILFIIKMYARNNIFKHFLKVKKWICKFSAEKSKKRRYLRSLCSHPLKYLRNILAWKKFCRKNHEKDSIMLKTSNANKNKSYRTDYRNLSHNVQCLYYSDFWKLKKYISWMPLLQTYKKYEISAIWLVEKSTILAVLMSGSQYCTHWQINNSINKQYIYVYIYIYIYIYISIIAKVR